MFSFLNPLPQLPKYKGQYQVGSAEFEIPISEIASSSVAPDSSITTVRFRIFYPTTAVAKSKTSIPWLPTPQKTWNRAYAQFMGMSEKKSSWLSGLFSVLDYATIPAIQNGPLLETSSSPRFPLLVFSHGLGGNLNTYSSLIGSLASCGVICVAPEHRDGSAPISLIKSSRNKVETSIPYRKIAHSPTAEVLNARNAMLRIRFWELEMIYSVLSQMSKGKPHTNYADTVSENSKPPTFQNCFDLAPGKVTWAGHSFGSATVVQFVKSIYYHKHAPKMESELRNDEDWDMEPLYTPAVDGDLVKQVTPESPVVLFDLWTMPLRGQATQWLWEKPLPCHDRRLSGAAPNTLSIMSAEFHKYPDLRNRTRAVLSASPVEALLAFEQAASGNQESSEAAQPATAITERLPTSKVSPPAEQDLHEPVEPELTPLATIPAAESENLLLPDTVEPQPGSKTSTRTPSPARSNVSNAESASSSQSSLPSQSSTPVTKVSDANVAPAHLYLIPNSAHLSQSDFGPLFPNLTRYLMKAQDPEKTIELNVRAVLAMLRGQGFQVGTLGKGKASKTEGDEDTDPILEDGAVIDRWQRVQL